MFIIEQNDKDLERQFLRSGSVHKAAIWKTDPCSIHFQEDANMNMHFNAMNGCLHSSIT